MAAKKGKINKAGTKKKNRKNKSPQSKPSIFNKGTIFPLMAILAITFFCFTTAIDNGFVNWDDDKNFYENELITTLTADNFWENTKKIFSTGVIGGYNPLTVFTFAIDKVAYGLDNPMPWHLENVLLHLLSTMLIYFIGRKLGLQLWASVFFALLFGIHPMRVESVAWVTERKDVLFGFFYLLSLLYYLKYSREEKKKKYLIIIWLSFILSLFSKIQAVILPISFVLVDYYFDSRLDFKKILNKAPFFLASLGFGILGIMFLQEQGSIESNNVYTGVNRLFIGAFQYTTYLIKSVVPFRLSPLYPYPSEIPWYFYVSLLSFVITGILLVISYMRKWKVIFFGLGFFVANIFFLLQILGAGQGFLADRFTYIAYLGLFFIFSYYLQYFLIQYPAKKNLILAAAAVVLGVYGIMTFNQNKIWKNSGTLWTHVLKYYKKSVLPFGNRANYYRDIGETSKALSDYNSRIRLKGDDAGVYNSRARLYFNFSNRDSLQKALRDYNKAIELNPNDPEYWANLGATYAKLESPTKAIESLNECLRLNPNYANAYLNRSVIHNSVQQFRKALDDLNMYIKFKPYNADIWYEKSRMHNILNEPNEGLSSINKALSYKNTTGLYYVEKSKAEFLLENFQQAKTDLNRAKQMGVKLNPELEKMIYSK